jgi:hypothetical protein
LWTVKIVFIRLARLLADKGKFGVKFRADIGQTTSKKGQTASKKGQNSGKVAVNLHISQKSINFAAQMKKSLIMTNTTFDFTYQPIANVVNGGMTDKAAMNKRCALKVRAALYDDYQPTIKTEPNTKTRRKRDENETVTNRTGTEPEPN